MTILGRGIDVALMLLGAAAWSLAAFALGTRFISPAAGGLLAVALLMSALALGVSSFVQEARMQRLAAGVCPHCSGRIVSEHRHRHWDAARSSWQAPSMSWECGACGYVHSETWACPTCPDA